MKKKYLIIILFALMLLPFKVNASGSFGLSTSSITMYPGESRTITISSSDSVGRLNISSSNGGVAAVSTGSVFIDTVGASKSFTITSGSIGSATISVVGSDNYASYSDMVSLEGMRRNITVNVVARPVAPTPSNPTPSTPAPSGPADTRSTNTGLSKLTVNGKELTNSGNVFILEVSNYVDKANIAAVVADSKSKVTGTGNMDLKVGENSFNIVVTAERGNTTTYVVKVIRKDANVLSDLDEVLKQNGDASIQINENDKLTKDQIDKIISSKKKVTLTKVDPETKKVLYSLILDGNNIKSSNEFNPNIVLVVEDNSDMEEAINYADGIYLDFSKCGDIPKGIILRYFVGDKYKDNDKVNLYSYDGSKVIQLKENIEVKDGYIEFGIEDNVRHLISKAKVLNAEVKKNDINIWFIVSIILAVVSVCLFFMFISSRTKLKKSKEENITNKDSVQVEKKNDIVEITDTKNTEKVKEETIKTDTSKKEEVIAETKKLEKLDSTTVVEKTEEPVIISEVKEEKVEEL